MTHSPGTTLPHASALVLLLANCGPKETTLKDTACDPAAYCWDLDGDGHGDPAQQEWWCADPPERMSSTCDDCDDVASSVHPGAVETCNALDDDCDGETDEADAIDAPSWYPDADGDGQGAEGAVAVPACDPPRGHAPAVGDCDDTDPSIHEGAPEVCNGLDDDCDGLVDERGATDGVVLHPDSDGDGFGSSVEGDTFCSTLEGWISDGRDCDDTDASIHPGVDEVCGNERDDNCDGDASECSGPSGEWSLVVRSDAWFQGDVDYDRAGALVASAGDLDGDGRQDILVGSLGGDRDGPTGSVWVFPGPSLGVHPLSAALAVFALPDELRVESLSAVSTAGDTNGDGFDDFLIGFPSEDTL